MSVSGISGGSQPYVSTGASMSMPPQQKMSQLYDKIDTTNSGSVSQSQFNRAFQTMNPPAKLQAMGADQIWSKLDPSGTGSVSKHDFVNTMKGVTQGGHHRHHRSGVAGGSAQAGQTAASATQALNSAGTTPASGASVNIVA